MSSTIMFNSSFLFIILLAFKNTHLISSLDVLPCIPLHVLSYCIFFLAIQHLIHIKGTAFDLYDTGWYT